MDATFAASEARYLTDAVLAPLAEAACEGAAELRELAPMLARIGPIDWPTRRQKKTWRRRVSRARWTRNPGRFVTDPDRIAIGHFDWDHADRQIRPPWER